MSRVTVGGSLDGGLLELRDEVPSCSSSCSIRFSAASSFASSWAMRSHVARVTRHVSRLPDLTPNGKRDRTRGSKNDLTQ